MGSTLVLGVVDHWWSEPLVVWTTGGLDQWTNGGVDHWWSGPLVVWTTGGVVDIGVVVWWAK